MEIIFLLTLYYGDGQPVKTIETRDAIHCQTVATRELHKAAIRAKCVKWVKP